MNKLQLTICFNSGTFKGVNFYNFVNESTLGFIPNKISFPELNLYGVKFHPKKHLSLIKEFNSDLKVNFFESEDYSGSSFEISYPGIQSPPQVFTWTLPFEKYTSLNFWQFLNNKDFIVGYHFHSDYVLWQTESIIDNYKAFNKPYSHLKQYWDEELQVNRVDISKNPGRIGFSSDLILMSCWRMYFGNKFFKYISKDKILSFEGAHKIEELDNENIFVELYSNVFESENEENIKKQRLFREWIGMDNLILGR